SEYGTWLACDPHARAYEVLLDYRSKEIVKNYYNLPAAHLARPQKLTLCLKCHVAPEVNARPCVPELFHADGVSCESCHGPAGKWLGLHYQAAWKALDRAEKEALGFRTTKDVVVRARLCAGCHVGAPGMDVNHDLIAAGHPRLNFEFAAYQA